MKRISLIAWLVASLAAGVAAAEPKEMAAAKAEFAKAAPGDETARDHYITRLARLREKLAEKNGNWQAVDAEIKRHPLPRSVDAAALKKLLTGQWSSPRREYLYRKDGTMTTLPAGPGTVEGHWHIEGNQLIEDRNTPEFTGGVWKSTIILLNSKDFIFTDGEVVFYDVRSGD